MREGKIEVTVSKYRAVGDVHVRCVLPDRATGENRRLGNRIESRKYAHNVDLHQQRSSVLCVEQHLEERHIELTLGTTPSLTTRLATSTTSCWNTL